MADESYDDLKVPVVVLAGGRGVRLQAVHAGVPKPMIRVGGRPFLEYIVDQLRGQGVREIIFSTGFQAEQIETHFSGLSRAEESFHFVREERPLGTGGALASCVGRRQLKGYFLAMNGDSLVNFRIADMIGRARGGLDGIVVATEAPDGARFGNLSPDRNGMLESFEEKPGGGANALINAGVYLFRADLFPPIPPVEPVSLERDLLPQWLGEGKKILVIRSQGPFIDIGTPESLASAPQFLTEFFPLTD